MLRQTSLMFHRKCFCAPARGAGNAKDTTRQRPSIISAANILSRTSQKIQRKSKTCTPRSTSQNSKESMYCLITSSMTSRNATINGTQHGNLLLHYVGHMNHIFMNDKHLPHNFWFLFSSTVSPASSFPLFHVFLPILEFHLERVS